MFWITTYLLVIHRTTFDVTVLLERVSTTEANRCLSPVILCNLSIPRHLLLRLIRIAYLRVQVAARRHALKHVWVDYGLLLGDGFGKCSIWFVHLGWLAGFERGDSFLKFFRYIINFIFLTIREAIRVLRIVQAFIQSRVHIRIVKLFCLLVDRWLRQTEGAIVRFHSRAVSTLYHRRRNGRRTNLLLAFRGVGDRAWSLPLNTSR